MKQHFTPLILFRYLILFNYKAATTFQYLLLILRVCYTYRTYLMQAIGQIEINAKFYFP